MIELNFKEFILGVPQHFVSHETPKKASKTFWEWLSEARTPACPKCGSPMVLRTARKGDNTGNQFYGCSQYPRCKGTTGYDSAVDRAVQPAPAQAAPIVTLPPIPQKPVTGPIWTYAKIISRNWHVPFGREIAVLKRQDGNWNYKVLDPKLAGQNGIIPSNEVQTIIQSFRDKDNKVFQTANPSLEDLNRKLNGEPDPVLAAKPTETPVIAPSADTRFDHLRPAAEQVRIPQERMTKYNIRIQDKFVGTKENIMIDALAGTGKTTMLKHLSSFIKPGERWLYLVFNKKNQIESQTAFPKGVDVKTTHSFLGELLKRNGKTVGGHTDLPPKDAKWTKIKQVLDRMIKDSWPESKNNYYSKKTNEMTSPFNWKAKDVVEKIASLAKNTALNPNDPKIQNQIHELISKHGIDTDLSSERNEQDRDYTPDLVQKVIELMHVTMPGNLPSHYGAAEYANFRDQDDTLWYTALNADNMNWKTGYDVVLMDEVQDFNRCQLIMAKKLKEAGARVVGVGDPNQAMYGFRGSDVDAFKELKGIIGGGSPEELPINFRSGGNIIDWVNKNTKVNRLQSAEHLKGKGEVYALNGTKPQVDYDKFMKGLEEEFFHHSKKFGEHTAIISRQNAPLGKAALHLLKANIPFEIIGKDLSGNLLKHIKKITFGKQSMMDIDDFANVLGDYLEKIRDKWGNKIAKKDELKEISDYTDVMMSVLQHLEENDYKESPDAPQLKTVKDFSDYLLRKLGGVDPDNAEAMAKLKERDPNTFVTLTTAHKSKGLEWDRVYLMNPKQYDPEQKKNNTEEKKDQERNAWYVAATRGKKNLYIGSNEE